MVTLPELVALRRFLFNMGQAKSRAYIINGLAMLASFFLFRNVLGVGVAPAGSGCEELTVLSIMCFAYAVRWSSGIVHEIASPLSCFGAIAQPWAGFATCDYLQLHSHVS